jgi:16S rRNA (uracil1498-N3)-methyltransferase
MHYFYLPPDLCQGQTLQLSGGEAHHALHVLRIRRGERVTALDGLGQKRECEVQETTRDQVNLKVLSQVSVPPLPYQVTLAQAIPKGKLIESIIQKATELGVFRIVPLEAQRTVVKLDPKEKTQKLAKWRLVAIEAIKQCGSAWLPLVEEPVTVEQFAAQHLPFEVALVGSLQPGSRHPREYFETFQQKKRNKPNSVCAAVGPEGDFTPECCRLLWAGWYFEAKLPRFIACPLSITNYRLVWMAKNFITEAN